MTPIKIQVIIFNFIFQFITFSFCLNLPNIRSFSIDTKNSLDFDATLNSNSYKRTCKNCKLSFIMEENIKLKSCNFHPGIYSGRLNRINDIDTSDLEYFWSCCGEYNISARGCINTYHATVSIVLFLF